MKNRIMATLLLLCLTGCQAGFGSRPEVSVVLVGVGGGFTRPDFIDHFKKYALMLPSVKAIDTEVIKAEGRALKAFHGVDILKIRIGGAKRDILVLPALADPWEAVLGVSTLEERFEIRSFVYAGSCGLLNDKYQVLDVFVPKDYHRSDYEYHRGNGQILNFPDWPSAGLQKVFAGTYTYAQKPNELVQSLHTLAESKFWPSLAAAILQDQEVKSKRTPAIFGETSNITGAHFISSDVSRKRYQRYFNADSVEMRAQQIVMAVDRLGIESVSVLSCGDQAIERPVDAMTELQKNSKAASYLVALSAIAAILGH